FAVNSTSNKILRILLMMNVAFSFVVILATGSKKGLIAFVSLLLFHLYKSSSGSTEKKLLFIPIILTVGFAFIQIFGGYISENFEIIERFYSMYESLTSTTYDESTDQRADFIEVGWNGFL